MVWHRMKRANAHALVQQACLTAATAKVTFMQACGDRDWLHDEFSS
jgi:hypothetical protein